MAIKDIVSLCAALIGSTATVLAAWSYIRTNHPPRGELLRALLIITITIACILGFAVFISRATTITVNGQDTIPVHVPGFSAPHQIAPTHTPTPTPSPSPTVSPSPSPSVTPSLSPTVSPSSSPSTVPSPTASPSSSPSVTPSPTP